VRMNNYLYALLQFVAKTFAKSNSPPITHSLGSVTRTGDANAYRAALQAALQSAPVAPETKLAPAPAGPLTHLSTVKLYMRIREMESPHQSWLRLKCGFRHMPSYTSRILRSRHNWT